MNDFKKSWLYSALFATVIGGSTWYINHSVACAVLFYGGLFALVAVPFSYVILRGAWQVGNAVGKGLVTASKPIPAPAELAQALEDELGRPVTLSEVLEVHEYLRSQRNQGLLQAGVGVGAFALIHHTLHDQT